MEYYKIMREGDPKIIGGRGRSQITGIDHGSVPDINKMLNDPDQNSIDELSKTIFQVQYHAKVTPVMTAIMFRRSLLFVDLDFLKCMDGLKSVQYFVAPAWLRCRKKYLDDYFLFHPIMVGNEQFINFKESEFKIKNRTTREIRPFEEKIMSYSDYANKHTEFRKKWMTLSAAKVKINKSWDYDYAYILERFIERLIKNKITGIRYSKIQLDPYKPF